MKSYATEQRKLLLAFLMEHHDRHFSVEEIADCLCGEKSISLSSIYRNINAMVKDGSVRRFTADSNRGFLYQYMGGKCNGHIHLKCESCGQVFHMDDSAMEEILTKALNNNDFSIDVSKAVLYGSCRDCEYNK